MPTHFKVLESNQVLKKVSAPFVKFYNNSRALINRRTHRSFQLTKRRDYKRAFNIPGYLALTFGVNKVLWKNKVIFIRLTLFYAILSAVLVGLASQDIYSSLRDTITTTSGDLFSGNLGGLGESTLLVLSAAFGLFNQSPNEIQQLYAFLLFILVWLSTVWLLRSIMAGNKVIVRDGLYNSFAPFLSTLFVSLILIVQLLPVALAMIGYSAAINSGLLDNGGVESMLFWAVVTLLVTLSLYWITTTFMALIVVTIPGTYPMAALRAGGDIVVGRRVRILLRLLWMVFVVLLVWLIVMIPIVFLDGWLKELWPAIDFVPVVPVCLLIASSFSLVWSSSYIYILYRKIVDGSSKPARS